MHQATVSPADLDIVYLQVNLQRLRLRLERAVQAWRLAGQDPGNPFRGLYVSDEEVAALLTRPVASSWEQAVSLPEEIEAPLAQQLARVERQAATLRDEAERLGHTLALEHLRAAFGLDAFELDVLLICLAPSIDLRYERIYGYLQDDVTKKRPTVNLALDLLAEEAGVGRLALLSHFEDDAPLVYHHLLEFGHPADRGDRPLLSLAMEIDDGILAWLLGRYQPHGDLAGAVAFVAHPADGLGPLADEALAERLAIDVLPEHLGGNAPRPLYLFHGQDSDTQLVAARLLAATVDKPLLTVDLAAIPERANREIGARRAVRLALRDARLTGAVPMFTGWDACLVGGNTPPALLHELYTFPGTVVVAGQTHWHPRGVSRVAASPAGDGETMARVTIEVAFPIPGYEQRRRLWAHYIGADGVEEDGNVLDALAGQFMLTSGQIRDAVATARDHAWRRSASGDRRRDAPGTSTRSALVTRDDLFAAARAHSNARLISLAHKITPRYEWDDIVLPEDQKALLREIVDTVRERSQVLDVWGIGNKLASSRGVTVLFSGPPGTGKTMSAEIIAGNLGLDLYRIDLSTIVSKYIGETEKNIEHIFREAEQSNAILFFDEADALFGKRSEVRDSHDRYANIEISYLLQRMEAYDGVTILATNLRGNLDEAFTRRLQFAVTFPFPEAEERRRIWTTLFPPEVPRGRDIDFGYLAERFRLAGGNIRNVIVSAAYLAAADGKRVTMAHLLHGTRRELQKMGRLVREEDLVIDRDDQLL